MRQPPLTAPLRDDIPRPVSVELLEHSGVTPAAWDQFAANHPHASCSHRFAVADAIRSAYGHPTEHWVAERQGELVGIVPLTRVASRLFGSSMVSMPYFDTGGILAVDPPAFAALAERAQERAAERAGGRLDVRQLGLPAGTALGTTTAKITLILDLEGTEEELWKRIGSKPRNQVRKAQKSGLTVEHGGAEGLADFYAVYATNMRDLGSPPHKLAWFETLFRALDGSIGCTRVLLDGRTVGGLIWLAFGQTMTVPWASSDRRVFKLCPNNLLYWETFRLALERRLVAFDFGRSSPGSGTHRFKRQWGAVETPLSWLDHQSFTGGAPAPTSTLADQSPRRQRLARGWQRLPVPVATWLGSRLRGGITL